GHVKRPLNEYILYRKDVTHEFSRAGKRLSVHDITTIANERRKNLGELERKFWKELALVAKKLHESKYPHYKFSPKRKSQKIVPSQRYCSFAVPIYQHCHNFAEINKLEVINFMQSITQ
ncbi:18913_t:CDS:1, partial [Acaulospora morrowiae]